MVKRIEEEIDRVFFVQVDFYDQLLFKANYDIGEKRYKADIRLPPGKHGICFIEALMKRAEGGEVVLAYKRIEWKNELVMPSDEDYSQEARIIEDPNAQSGAGTLFTSRAPLLRCYFVD